MKTILVDDEPNALRVLEHMLSPYDDINIIGSFTRPADALNSIKDEKPDIIFLDIEMGDINGLELANMIISQLEQVEIIFVTAYSQYAVEAFEVNAIDLSTKTYSRKPSLKGSRKIKRKLQRKKDR